MDREKIMTVVLGIVLIVALFQAFQLSGLAKSLQPGQVQQPQSAGNTGYPTSTSTAAAKPTGGAAQVGGC